MTDGIRRKQQTSMPIANRRNAKKNTTRGIGYTRIYLVSGRPLAFVASLDVIQRQGAIRDNNVLTWREDSEGAKWASAYVRAHQLTAERKQTRPAAVTTSRE